MSYSDVLTSGFAYLFFSCMTAAYLQAQTKEPEPLRYSISFEEAKNHYAHVELEMVTGDETGQELFLPTWTPGSYLMREYSQHVDNLTAVDKAGKSLPVVKTSKNQWKIACEPHTSLQVRYRIYCNELSVRTNFVDNEFGILNGAATFLTCPMRLKHPHVLSLKLNPAWHQSISSLDRTINAAAHSYTARDYDELVDSPILVGNPVVHPFQVGGVQHFLVNQGGDGLWDGDQAAADTAKIVAEHQRMWGVVPYKPYYFLNLIAESGGGLEHDNSTVLLTSRWSFRNEKNYQRWLGLVSHEFFHAWNVRRLRPKSLAEYDYQHENYLDELWMAEGVTSYYEDLALARVGILSTKEYLTELGKQIETLQTTPGRLQQSLAESSHDAWIKFYRSNENSRNTSISYYNKGAIVAFLLDLQIRQYTRNEKSLDDVMRQLYQRHAGQAGYTHADILSIVNEVSGQDLTNWLHSAINTTEELDYSSGLEWLGLRFKDVNKSPNSTEQASASRNSVAEKKDDAKKDDAKEGVETQPASKSTAWLGVTTAIETGRVMVKGVVDGSPAFDAGLNVGDEIIGLNHFRVTDSIDERLKQYKPGETASIQYSRRGKLSEVLAELASTPVLSWTLELVEKPTEAQTANLANWLRTPTK